MKMNCVYTILCATLLTACGGEKKATETDGETAEINAEPKVKTMVFPEAIGECPENSSVDSISTSIDLYKEVVSLDYTEASNVLASIDLDRSKLHVYFSNNNTIGFKELYDYGSGTDLENDEYIVDIILKNTDGITVGEYSNLNKKGDMSASTYLNIYSKVLEPGGMSYVITFDTCVVNVVSITEEKICGDFRYVAKEFHFAGKFEAELELETTDY